MFTLESIMCITVSLWNDFDEKTKISNNIEVFLKRYKGILNNKYEMEQLNI